MTNTLPDEFSLPDAFDIHNELQKIGENHKQGTNQDDGVFVFYQTPNHYTKSNISANIFIEDKSNGRIHLYESVSMELAKLFAKGFRAGVKHMQQQSTVEPVEKGENENSTH